MAAISGQPDPSSAIVKAQICTVFICLAQVGSYSLNSHLIFQGWHESNDSISHGLIILSSLNGSFPSLTTLVIFNLLHVLQVDVIFLHGIDKPEYTKFALTLSSNLLDHWCCRLSWYHSSRLDCKVGGSQI